MRTFKQWLEQAASGAAGGNLKSLASQAPPDPTDVGGEEEEANDLIQQATKKKAEEKAKQIAKDVTAVTQHMQDPTDKDNVNKSFDTAIQQMNILTSKIS